MVGCMILFDDSADDLTFFLFFQATFHSVELQNAAGTDQTLTVYVCSGLHLVVPRDVAPLVNLLPHSLRGCLSKLKIKTTANADLTDKLGRAGVIAKSFLSLEGLELLLSTRKTSDVAETLAHRIREATKEEDMREEEENESEGRINEEEEEEEEEEKEDEDEEKEEKQYEEYEDDHDDGESCMMEEDGGEDMLEGESLPALSWVVHHDYGPPPILQRAPVPLPQPPVLLLPTHGWTASHWSGKRFSLRHYDMGSKLRAQLKNFQKFWGNAHVPNRKGGKLSSETIRTRIRRICAYLGFLKQAKAVHDARKLTLEAILDDKAVVSFLDWLENTRDSSEGNRVEYISAVISAVKFLFRDVSEDIKGMRCSRITVIQRYKDLRNSLQSISARKKRSRHDLEEEGRWVDWNEGYLPMVEAQQALYDECDGEQSKKVARMLHDLLLLRWQTVSPSRAGEIRTVEYLSWEELNEHRGRRSVGQWARSAKRNVLTKRPTGGHEGGGGEGDVWTLYLAVYKTARWTGVDITELDDQLFPELCSALDVYLSGSGDNDTGPLRSLLNPLDDHHFVFMSTTGTPLSETYFSTYFASLIERHTGSRPTASMLRSSFITSMLDSEIGGDMRNREAMAEQMRHSVQEQSRTYDRRLRQRKKRKALELASQASVVTSPPSKESALVSFARDDVVSVRRVGGSIIAKVIRGGPEGFVLMGMRHVEGPFYAVDVQDIWMQPDTSVLQFVDAVWDQKHQCYEVRSGFRSQRM